MKLNRRQLLGCGIAGSVLLTAGGYWLWPQPAAGFVASGQDRQWLQRLAPALLGERVPCTPATVAANVLLAIASLPLPLQQEVRELFDLLQQPLVRRWLAGIPVSWQDASPQQIRTFLQRWRHSRFALQRSAYQALHNLVYAAHYGNIDQQHTIGYRLPGAIQGFLR
ncbi:hypothetical protein ACFSQE_09600 [Vogesella fluminis]|uniref:Twin-arginine translocation pathway signal protein n=1 Tax=Vogesella fluminis TaxID=1069161 RepID=A0ABQ3HH00_9NEIS|nr:hypothetical protein [Vogesella fluminis]GHD81612.1 hypothetical protein GCM10011419_27880 [Vogesella fluminis]